MSREVILVLFFFGVGKKELRKVYRPKIQNFRPFFFLSPFTEADIISFLSGNLTSRPFYLEEPQPSGRYIG
jgi:hypothetical protein